MTTRIVKIVLSQADLDALGRAQADLSGAVHWSRSALVRQAIRWYYQRLYDVSIGAVASPEVQAKAWPRLRPEQPADGLESGSEGT